MKTQVFQEQNQQSANILDNSNQIQWKIQQKILMSLASLRYYLTQYTSNSQIQTFRTIKQQTNPSQTFNNHSQNAKILFILNFLLCKFQEILKKRCFQFLFSQQFDQRANNFSLNGTSKLIDQILKCKTIEKLRLNPFIHQSILDCSTALNDCQNLKNLTLKFQKFKNEELKNLGICLANCKNIKNLTVNISQDSNFNDEQEVIDFLQDISFNHQIFTLNLFLPQDNQIFHNQYLYFNKRFSWNEQFQLNRQKIAHFIKELQEVSIFLDRLY
ncbi:hypothetical protein ABPG73_021514 [Tetrahymena malaccensis]